LHQPRVRHDAEHDRLPAHRGIPDELHRPPELRRRPQRLEPVPARPLRRVQLRRRHLRRGRVPVRRAAIAALAAAIFAAACERPDDVDSRTTRTLPEVEAPPFDGQAAFALLERQVEFGPRVPGSPGHAAQLAWMEEYLRERADTVILQHFDHRAKRGGTIRMTNVFARFRPELPDRVLFLAHWDTRPTADNDPDPSRRNEPILGANDGASGVAVLLQLADVLSRHSPPIGVDLLFTDGEDFGPDEMYLGATYFAANPVPGPGYRPLYGVLVDMVGDRNP